MNQSTGKTRDLNFYRSFFRPTFLILAVFLFSAAAFVRLNPTSAQNATVAGALPPTPFKVGEKLTYGISYGRFKNIGFAELYTVSRGKLEGRDAVELRMRVKTNDLVSAAFYMLDESRTTFAAADSGLPLYVRKIVSSGVAPVETSTNFVNNPTQNLDLLTMIYRLRNLGGTGSFLFQDGDRTFSLTAQPTTGEKVKTDAGDFETTISSVQSDFLSELGMKDFRVNFTSDDRKIPVLIRFKTDKGEFEAAIASIQTIVPEGETAVVKTPVPTPTPVLTPTPVPTPTPSLDNLPLSVMLPFELGEVLDYRITTGGAPVGTFRLHAESRRFIEKRDVLTLKATISGAERGFNLFAVNDSITALVNAESLAPYQFDVKLTGGLSSFNQSIRFDQQRGIALVGGVNQVQVPVHTHSLLSLAYAIRSFNLKPSKDPKNPVNDTRVSVFYESQFYVFTIRPLGAENLTFGTEKVNAQLVTIITGNPQLDALALKVWLRNDEKRTPVRFAIGKYQADLIGESLVLPK